MRANAEAEATKMRAGAQAEATKLNATADAERISKTGLAEAEKIMAIGKSTAEAYELAGKAMGGDNFTKFKITEEIGKGNIKIIPDLIVSGDGRQQWKLKRVNGFAIASNDTGKKGEESIV
jgi:uncharacterized membrane protein YqiK